MPVPGEKGEAVGVRPAALTGMGGVGKTQLAVEYAYRYRNAYPDGTYWVNAAESWQGELAALAEPDVRLDRIERRQQPRAGDAARRVDRALAAATPDAGTNAARADAPHRRRSRKP